MRGPGPALRPRPPSRHMTASSESQRQCTSKGAAKRPPQWRPCFRPCRSKTSLAVPGSSLQGVVSTERQPGRQPARRWWTPLRRGTYCSSSGSVSRRMTSGRRPSSQMWTPCRCTPAVHGPGCLCRGPGSSGGRRLAPAPCGFFRQGPRLAAHQAANGGGLASPPAHAVGGQGVDGRGLCRPPDRGGAAGSPRQWQSPGGPLPAVDSHGLRLPTSHVCVVLQAATGAPHALPGGLDDLRRGSGAPDAIRGIRGRGCPRQRGGTHLGDQAGEPRGGGAHRQPTGRAGLVTDDLCAGSWLPATTGSGGG